MTWPCSAVAVLATLLSFSFSSSFRIGHNLAGHSRTRTNLRYTIQSRILKPESDVTCESIVLQVFRQGISSESSYDVLQSARDLDLGRTQQGQGQAKDRPLLGVPIYVVGADDVLRKRLGSAGALLFGTGGGIMDGRNNPRDQAMKISRRFSESDVAVESIVRGNVAAAILPVPDDSTLFFPESISWTGLVAARLKDDGGLGERVICGTSLADTVGLVQTLYTPDFTPITLEDKPTTNLPLAGIRVAVLSHALADPLSPVEESVRQSMIVFEGDLKKMGAEIFTVKGRPDNLEAILQDKNCDILISPSTATAAHPIGSSVDGGGTKSFDSGRLDAGGSSLFGGLSVTIPIGLVAGDDAGYDASLNEERDREGLPICALLVACGSGNEREKSKSKTLFLGLEYEKYSRWSSEVFASGQTREQAQEDMDDAREAFGIYFASSLVRYLAKRRVAG